MAAFVVAAAGVGCGTTDDEEEIRKVMDAYVGALGREDGGAACDQLTAPALEELESSSGQRCREVITRLDQQIGAVVRVDVAGVSAKVDLEGGDTAFLSREAAGWRIGAAGCRPGAKPADRPYECEVQA